MPLRDATPEEVERMGWTPENSYMILSLLPSKPEGQLQSRSTTHETHGSERTSRSLTGSKPSEAQALPSPPPPQAKPDPSTE